MGALEFIPEMGDFAVKEPIDLQELLEISGKVFLDEDIVLPEESLAMRTLFSVGSSAGGRQPKAVIAIHKETGEVRSGQNLNDENYTHYLIKFGDEKYPSTEVEMTYYEMSIKAKIEMMPCHLMKLNGRNHFLTERFDRVNGEKLHMQTLAAMWPDANSYEALMWVCRKLRLPAYSCDEVFRRMVFNVLTNNVDDHKKNFSFIMDKSGRWRLAPNYDVTFIFNNGGHQAECNHSLSVRGKVSNITIRDLLEFAKENGVRTPNLIINEVVEAVREFKVLSKKYGVDAKKINTISSTISDILVSWGFQPINRTLSYVVDGCYVANVRLESSYRGNLHLMADINGHKDIKYIFRQGTETYDELIDKRLEDLPEEKMKNMIRSYLLPKVKRSNKLIP